MKRNLILLAAVLSLSVISCKTASNATMDKQEQVQSKHNQLQGEWVLSSVDESLSQGKSLKDLFPGKTPFVIFDTENQTLSGNDGCNNIFGGYTITGTTGVSIGNNLGSTMMACQGVSDYLFKQGLSEMTNFSVQDNILVIYAKDKPLMSFTLKDEKQSSKQNTQINLDKTKWVLTFIQPKDRSIQSLQERFPMELPTINFEENRINGTTGCNVYNGEYSEDNDQITFDKVAMTRRFCNDVQEHLFTENLNSVAKFKVENDELVLSTQDDLVVLRFKQK
ncbi:META domain-containing protein [Myroides sp. LJL119]